MKDPRTKPPTEPPWPLKGSVWREQIRVSMWKGTPEGPERIVGAAYTEALEGERRFRITVFDAGWDVVYDCDHYVEGSEIPAERSAAEVAERAVMHAYWIAEGALWPFPEPQEPG